MSNWKENQETEEAKNIYMNPCKVCKKEISINAKICPNCGEVNPNISLEKKAKIRQIEIIIATIPLIFILGAGATALYFLYKLKSMLLGIG